MEMDDWSFRYEGIFRLGIVNRVDTIMNRYEFHHSLVQIANLPLWCTTLRRHVDYIPVISVVKGGPFHHGREGPTEMFSKFSQMSTSQIDQVSRMAPWSLSYATLVRYDGCALMKDNERPIETSCIDQELP